MPEFAFDLKLWATARVVAQDEQSARAKLMNYGPCLDISMTTPDGVTFTEASIEGEAGLVEIDGEAT